MAGPSHGSGNPTPNQSSRPGPPSDHASNDIPVLGPDFQKWTLIPPAIGILGAGAYYGYRAEVRKLDAADKSFVLSKGSTAREARRFAAKAFLYGSALSVGTFSTLVLATGYVMDVKTIPEFCEKMRIWTPKQLRKLGYRQSPESLTVDEASEKEWRHILDLINKEEKEFKAQEAQEASRTKAV